MKRFGCIVLMIFVFQSNPLLLSAQESGSTINEILLWIGFKFDEYAFSKDISASAKKLKFDACECNFDIEYPNYWQNYSFRLIDIDTTKIESWNGFIILRTNPVADEFKVTDSNQAKWLTPICIIPLKDVEDIHERMTEALIRAIRLCNIESKSEGGNKF
jgi:hypothetical protein